MSMSIAAMDISRLYTCLYYILKDVVELLNPEGEVSREECSGESSVSAVEAECEPQPLDVDVIEEEDETQVATISALTFKDFSLNWGILGYFKE